MFRWYKNKLKRFWSKYATVVFTCRPVSFVLIIATHREYAQNLGENRAKVDGFSKQLPFHRGFSDVKSWICLNILNKYQPGFSKPHSFWSKLKPEIELRFSKDSISRSRDSIVLWNKRIQFQLLHYSYTILKGVARTDILCK